MLKKTSRKSFQDGSDTGGRAISIGREDLENCVEGIKASCSIGTVAPDMVEKLVKPCVTLAAGGVGGVLVDHDIPQLGDVCGGHWQEGGEHREQVFHGLEEDCVCAVMS